jgi:hypothetical protein
MHGCGRAHPITAAMNGVRHDIVTSPAGKQILLENPSGNPIELFQPAGR